jgi:hypothetical protein
MINGDDPNKLVAWLCPYHTQFIRWRKRSGACLIVYLRHHKLLHIFCHTYLRLDTQILHHIVTSKKMLSYFYKSLTSGTTSTTEEKSCRIVLVPKSVKPT